ncbi:DUF1205 domain-containing protein [Streptomyces sp. ISL-12]|uniref:nucleotide disphospho-sugar-binding domain-containing protein n=1 Tax=Streptomyces sp. ISL-12 TaxID=2819177 RepID=UPI001BEA0E71|nr:nucleotide disphospho-sugar-binding domain-containing protein [Streptomyces sp. ISL-12]MBT2414374.1 DUF1205 domain-containing protein [Streptomyces sp. ISL-12]
MRVLSTAAPGAGLFLPTVPLAWALRAAGHEVLVMNTGGTSRSVAAGGFWTVDAAPGTDVHADFLAASQAVQAAPDGQRPRRSGMGMFGEAMADGLLRAAEAFRPDLVVSTLEQGAGELVATRLGIPYVEQSVRLAWAGPDEQAVTYRRAVAEYLLPTRERLGIGEPWREPAAVLDIRPAGLGGGDTRTQWPLRYVPYNEGRVLPDWVLAAPGRPRVCVTMGSVLGNLPAGSELKQLYVAVVREILVELAGLGVEVVVAMGESDLEGIGELPEAVRVVGWMPLGALLPTCSAVVHHAGAGTSMTSLALGVPQVVLPQTADQPANARVLAARGVAALVPPDRISAAEVRQNLARVLDEPAFRTAAHEVQEEIRVMPSPAEVVDRLASLVA